MEAKDLNDSGGYPELSSGVKGAVARNAVGPFVEVLRILMELGIVERTPVFARTLELIQGLRDFYKIIDAEGLLMRPQALIIGKERLQQPKAIEPHKAYFWKRSRPEASQRGS